MANKDLAADVREAFMSYDTDVAAIHIMECDGCAGGCSESAEVMLRFARRLLSRERLSDEEIREAWDKWWREELDPQQIATRKHYYRDGEHEAVVFALYLQDHLLGPVGECDCMKWEHLNGKCGNCGKEYRPAMEE